MAGADRTGPLARLSRAPGLRETPVGEDLVLLDPTDYRAITLNRWAREIWQLLDGERALDDVVGELDRRFDAEAGRVEREVREVVDEMLANGILREVSSDR